MKNYTYSAFLSAIANGEQSAELQATASELLQKHNTANANRNSKSAEKRSIENAPIIESIVSYLKSNNGAHTASEIASAIGISTPKATALLRKVEGVQVSEAVVNKRIVKAYSL